MSGAVHVSKLGIVVADIIDFGTVSGVSQIIAGTAISVAPATGIGTVTVTNAGVTSLLAGAGITLAPVSGIGNVTITVTSITDTITPTTVDASGQTAGVNVKTSASDHKHQLANPITGAMTVNGILAVNNSLIVTPTADVVSLSVLPAVAGVSDVINFFDNAANLQFQLTATGTVRTGPLGGLAGSIAAVLTIIDSLGATQMTVQNGFIAVTNVLSSPTVTITHSIGGNALSVTNNATILGVTAVANLTLSVTFGANNVSLQGLFVSGNIALSTRTGLTINGLRFAPNISTATAATVTTFAAIVAAPTYSTASVTVTNEFGLQVTIFGGVVTPTITTATGVKISFGATAAPATVLGLDIDSITTGTTRIGIRQSGTVETNRFAGNIVIGSTTVAPTQPLQLLKAATNALISGGVSGEANFRVQIQHDQLQFGPGGAVALDTFLQRTAANQLDINAVLRPSPDNTYDIGTITAGTVRWRHGFYSGSLRASFSGNAASYIQLRHDGTVANIETALAAGGDTTLVMATEILEIAGSGSLGLHQLWLGGSSLVGIIRTAALNLQLNTNSIVHPDTDNLRDFGDNATPLRWRGGFFAGQVTARNKPVIVVENLDETQASATVPNVDTTLKSYALPANSYTKIIVEAEGYITTTGPALSAQQDLNIKLKAGASQIGNTVVFNPETVAAGGKIPFTIKATALQAGAATLALTIGAAVADVNTTVFANSFRVYGES